ncbi:unnamed protein product [Linum tenue]|uniref:Uncharacterized protein n=1 Tax=Linum tenue TaxID=586396 RepID=A0AAV0JRU4_9ROSI|nr:unnamed protein product [Linum tenue]
MKANKPPPPPPLQFPKLEDDLMVEILVRSFPDPKSAGRCKLVCKRWRNLIGGTRFMHCFASRHQFLLARGILSTPRNNITAGENQTSRCWAELISWEPRAFVYHNFLSKTECEHLISQAKPQLARSKVFCSETRMNIESSNRTSSQGSVGSSNVVTDIEKRIADFTSIPVENGERLHVVHYEVGQKFEPHFDYSPSEYYDKTGGARAASVLMYLRKGERLGLSVKPKMGDALVFWSMKPDGGMDPSSMHATRLGQQRRDALKANNPPPPPPQQFPKLEDDLMVEILVRSFPDPKSAGRCKLVCKRWRNLIAGTRFKHSFASRHQFLLARGILSIPRNNITAGENQTSRCWAELISWEPRAFIYHNFLSKTECEHLISRAKPQNGEHLNVVHYEVGQKLEPHFDYTGPHDYYTKTGGARAASILMYLSREKKRKRLGLSVKPKMGDALVFWNIKPDGNVDPCSKHAGSAVIKGDKWLALNFMRVNKRKVQNG